MVSVFQKSSSGPSVAFGGDWSLKQYGKKKIELWSFMIASRV